MKTNSLKMVIVVSLIMIGSACSNTPNIITVPMELQRPARPVLPRITPDEANEIPHLVWVKLQQRNVLRRQYCEKLEVIIDGTKQARQ